MFKHFQHIDCILASIELAKAQIFGEKSRWCHNDIIVVEYACDYNDCCPEAVKIAKIVK